MRHASNKNGHKRFVLHFLLSGGLACLAVLSLNMLVDPLWYFGGNRLTGKNIGFNEREAKLNLFLQNPGRYDCLIFGSSRATWLPGSALVPLKCFNLSFSSGQPEEFLAFAEYLHARGFRPRHVVIGVDGFIFQHEGRDPVNIPAHVSSREAPPSPLSVYLSSGALGMSWKTLFDDSTPPGYYNEKFEKVLRPDPPIFNPQRTLAGEGLRRADVDARRRYQYYPDAAAIYAKLARVFPEATILAYVPPISAWHIGEMKQYGVLDGYIRSLHATAELLPTLIDFSMPSPITWDTANTYDGSHYLPSVNRSIADILLGRSLDDWGIAPHSLDLDSYRARYDAALADFMTQKSTEARLPR